MDKTTLENFCNDNGIKLVKYNKRWVKIEVSDIKLKYKNATFEADGVNSEIDTNKFWERVKKALNIK